MLLWDHVNLTAGRCSKGAGARPNYAKRLLKECAAGRDRLVETDVELRNLLLDRVQWRRRISSIVQANYND